MTRIVVDIFPSNALRDMRVDFVNDFIDEHNMRQGFPGKIKVFTFEKRGRNAIIQFESVEHANQFHKDNREELFKCVLKKDGEEDRTIYFNKGDKPAVRRCQTATRHLLKFIVGKKMFLESDISVEKKAGQILIKDYPIFKITCNDDLVVKFFVDKYGTKESKIEGIETKAEDIIKEFSAVWK